MKIKNPFYKGIFSSNDIIYKNIFIVIIIIIILLMFLLMIIKKNK